MFGPTLMIGSIVRYVMQPSDFGPASVNKANPHSPNPIVRAAVVTDVWGNEKTNAPEGPGCLTGPTAVHSDLLRVCVLGSLGAPPGSRPSVPWLTAWPVSG